MKLYLNSTVYGFDYIYEVYKDLVLYFVGKNDRGDFTVGTGFKYANGIVTAKHCIEDVISLQVKGYKAVDLANKPVYISDNEALDIAFIETGEVASPYCFADEGEVLQEVLVMGYPKIPTFTDFLVAEKAMISSKASARLTPTKGCISAFGNEYLSKIEAMLITAKITGGNSGGPVINQYGCIVGVACRKPSYDDSYGDYDDLGYGIAIPMKQVIDVINKKPKKYDIPNDFFQDFDAGD